ncbi:unnamed protein product [Blepharisma stoltei]|uniref:C2H2-type domain-containing protein n=1 Tax=Blepharisma stoltei TaxID=1481888 RepID=A0AAU9JIX3_9CILI|nr:unnamed protein product [Blepharisma stoltei]
MGKYKCPYEECGLEYSKNSNLHRHINTFHLKIRFSCTKCGKEVTSAQSLKDHGYFHSRAKPYMCKICRKRFRQISQLSVHRRKYHSDAKSKNKPEFVELKVNFMKINLFVEKIAKTYEIPSGPFTLKDARLPPISNK